MCLCAALQANVIPKPDGMACHCIALHYIDWDEDDEVGTGDHTAVAGALQQEVIYSEEDLKRQEESNDLRRAVLPVRLMERVSNKWAFAPSTEIQNHHAMCKEEEEEEEEETKPHSLWQRIFFSFLGFASREIKDCSVADFCWC
jgi:hypothetical protein